MATKELSFEVTGRTASALVKNAEEIARSVGVIQNSTEGTLTPARWIVDVDGKREVTMWEQSWQFVVRTEG